MNAHSANIGHATPEAARRIFDALCDLRDRLCVLRGQLLAERAPLADRMAAGFIQGDLEQAIKTTRRYLTRVARHGGHGLPLGAGQGPASAPGASIGHGSPALSPAIGTRCHKASGAAEAAPDNRLFHAQSGKPCQR